MTILLASRLDAAERLQWLTLLRALLPHETIVDERPADAATSVDIALVANPPPGALQGLGGLRLIQSLWAGVERLLADPTLPPDVPLARMVDPAMSEAMAQTALWAVLSLQRDCFDYAAQQRRAQWQPWPQRRADEIAVVVLGQGQMGMAVRRRLEANGYRVLGWSTREGRWPDLLGDADVVVNLLPLTPATQGLLDARAFAAMRRGAGLVNLARGAHVVDADLLAALDGGQLRHAVLDVFHTEPLPPEHRYWSHPRVTVLPHVAAQTDPRSAAAIVAAQVRALRAGAPLQHLVDRARGY
ncbi:MAG: glyoxylate/hydroxypyruvate reductase A [Piscinibacter sp.]|nr:glyoxylate/hydroxypyruvate reductase A [Piscinibacter sp.]